MAKKGHKGQKKLQGKKAKAVQTAKKTKAGKQKAKTRKTQSKAVKTNLKKMSFDNSKKIEALNGDITKVLMAPPKLNFLSPHSMRKNVEKPPAKDMPDVGSIEQKMAQM